MAIDFRDPEHLSPGIPSQEPRRRRELPIHCPTCTRRIEIPVGLCGQRLIDTILLQSERLGAELECRECGHRFVYQRPSSLTSSQQPFKTKRGTIHPL